VSLDAPGKQAEQAELDALAALRAQIDGVDDQLARLLDQRAALVEQIAAVKRAGGIAARDEGRERAVLARLAGRAGARFPREALEAVYREIMRACLALHGDGGGSPAQ
jgi:chorismate mutase / prephenate dehydratase